MLLKYGEKMAFDTGGTLLATSIFSWALLEQCLVILIIALLNAVLVPLINFCVKKIKTKITNSKINEDSKKELTEIVDNAGKKLKDTADEITNKIDTNRG